MRAGAHALSLLSVPLNVQVLEALREGPTPLIELRPATGSPPATTLRGHLRTLEEAGIVERRRQGGFPGPMDLNLTPAGHALLQVAAVLRDWLRDAPNGPTELGTPAAKSAIRALIDGWSTGVIRVLAARRLSLIELSELITTVTYPSLERRLGAMRVVGQLERSRSNGRGTPYAVTDWLRRAAAPLMAAVRWEQRNPCGEGTPATRLDAEGALLLAGPLISLDDGRSGLIRLGVESRHSDGELKIAGVTLKLTQGRVSACATQLARDPDAWASGRTGAWWRTLIDGEGCRMLELGGDRELARSAVAALHRALRTPQPDPVAVP